MRAHGVGLDKGNEGIVAKFTDDTKIDGRTDSVKKMGKMQKDLGRLGEWAKKWQMEYNVGKCDVVHFLRNNKGIDYFLNGERLQKPEAQRDLGALVQDSLKVN
eukprot:g20378.t1